jgi:hypothetical protein
MGMATSTWPSVTLPHMIGSAEEYVFFAQISPAMLSNPFANLLSVA